MKLSPEERASHREAFRRMNLAEKLDYILSYYRLEIVIGLIAAVALGSILHAVLTRRERVVYIALANVVVSDEAVEALTGGYLRDRGYDEGTFEVGALWGLYLSDAETSADTRLSYASRLKLLGSIDSEQLDVVIMDKAASELLDASGYLLDLGGGATYIADDELAGLAAAGVPRGVYAGIIGNTPREEAARDYLRWLGADI